MKWIGRRALAMLVTLKDKTREVHQVTVNADRNVTQVLLKD